MYGGMLDIRHTASQHRRANQGSGRGTNPPRLNGGFMQAPKK
jgi:hypothetical protein